MTHVWKIALPPAVILLLGLSTAVWSAPQQTDAANLPAFSARDRELIVSYYTQLRGTLAPGSLGRTAFSIGIERVLVRGSHIPIQLSKQLERLPQKLGSQLSPAIGDYAAYRLGYHVVLVNSVDMTIADILKNIVPK